MVDVINPPVVAIKRGQPSPQITPFLDNEKLFRKRVMIYKPMTPKKYKIYIQGWCAIISNQTTHECVVFFVHDSI